MLRLEADGSLATHADLSALADRAVERDRGRRGAATPTSTTSASTSRAASSRPGSIALVTPDGEARQVADGMAFPNGMAITPDGATLIVAESYAHRLTAFDIGERRRPVGPPRLGRPRRRRTRTASASTPTARSGTPTCRTALRARPRGRRGARRRSTLDRGCFACMLGGDDGRTLFMVADEWNGPAQHGGAADRTGLTWRAPAPHAGRP